MLHFAEFIEKDRDRETEKKNSRQLIFPTGSESRNRSTVATSVAIYGSQKYDVIDLRDDNIMEVVCGGMIRSELKIE